MRRHAFGKEGNSPLTKVLICGGRDFEDAEFAFEALDRLHVTHAFTHVIHGGARGADSIGGAWGAARGLTRSRRRAKPVGEKNETMKSRKAESRPGIDDLSELCRKAYMRRLSTDLPSKQATEPQSRKQRPKNKRSGQRKHSVRT
jgi:hypothetical protein